MLCIEDKSDVYPSTISRSTKYPQCLSILSTIAAWSETLFKSKRNTSMKRSIINKSSLNSPEINIKRQLLHTKTFVQDQPTCKVEFQLCLCLSLILVADIPLRWATPWQRNLGTFSLLSDTRWRGSGCSLFTVHRDAMTRCLPATPVHTCSIAYHGYYAALHIMDIMHHCLSWILCSIAYHGYYAAQMPW